MPLVYEDNVRGRRREAFDIPARRSEVLREQFAQTFEENPIMATLRFMQLRADERTGPRLSAEEARARLRDAGMERDLEISDAGITEAALQTLMERKRVEKRRQEIFARAEGGVAELAARLGVALATTFADPIGAGLNFVPIVGQARYARWLASARTFAGRLAVRAGVGTVEGMAGAALAEPFVYVMRTQEQADYDMVDSLMNIAFGGVAGAGLHTIVGSTGELFTARLRTRQVRTEPVAPERAPEPEPGPAARPAPEPLPADIQAALFDTPRMPELVESLPRDVQQAALRAAVGQAVEGRPVDVDPIVRAATVRPTETPEFRQWFGDSRVIDRSGKPLVVYHGTREREAILREGFRPSDDGGIYFTDRPLDALEFATRFKFEGGPPKVIKAALRMRNPLEIDAGGEIFEPEMMERAIREAREGGHDGVIVRNIQNFEHGEPSTTFVVFDNSQIRGLREGIDRLPSSAPPTPDPEFMAAADAAEETLARDMPSTSDATLRAAEEEADLALADARALAERLGVEFRDPDLDAVNESIERAERWARAAELATVCLVRGG